MAQSRHSTRVATRVATRAVLKGLVMGGALVGVAVAPNSLILIDRFLKKVDKKRAQRTLSYLKYRKLIEVKEIRGEKHYKLTKKGRSAYSRILIDELAIKTPKTWDHKWRLVMFDIPQSFRGGRQGLLAKLKELNFYMIQQSAWIHPFDCETQIGVLLEALSLEKYVSYMVVEETNFTEHATEHFKKQKLLM